MQILADMNMTGVDETFGQQGNIRRFNGRELRRDALGDAQVLLVRSVTHVDANLLAGSRVRFVGTATIGTDHLDTHWLDQQGITWASAPGCNAVAAAQYTLGMMCLACQRLGRRLADQRVAIIGHGNVGSRVHTLLRSLGASVAVYDPPLADAGVIDHLTLEEALNADIVTLHVPLERCGDYPTHHMINLRTLSEMRPGALLVNAARGKVVHEAALLEALVDGRVYAALDVWPSEPRIGRSLLKATSVASPHVAGYSVEGKIRGTQMIFQAFMAWLDAPLPDASSIAAQIESLEIPCSESMAHDVQAWLAEAVIQATHVAQDDARMRTAMPDSAVAFDTLRRAHAPRHEFAQLRLSTTDSASRAGLVELGFGLA